MLNLEKKVFPPCLTRFINESIDILDHDDNFFDEEDIPQGYREIALIMAHNRIGDNQFPNFINNEDYGFKSDDEINQILAEIIIDTTMISLKDKNLADYIENENGDIVTWLTPQGQDMGEQLICSEQERLLIDAIEVLSYQNSPQHEEININ